MLFGLASKSILSTHTVWKVGNLCSYCVHGLFYLTFKTITPKALKQTWTLFFFFFQYDFYNLFSTCVLLSTMYQLQIAISSISRHAHFNHDIINRPGVTGAVLQRPLLFISSLIHPLPPNPDNIITPKPLKLGSWNFERTLISHHMSHVMCHMSWVTCHVSHVTCHMSCVTIFF